MAQSESRVEHAVQRQHENAAERGFRGGLLPEARWQDNPIATLRLPEASRITLTAARAAGHRVGDAFSGVRNPGPDLRQRNCYALRWDKI